MLTVEIEKEIQQENKILLNFNLRQVVCLCAAAGVGVVCAVFLDMEFLLAVYPCLAAGGDLLCVRLVEGGRPAHGEGAGEEAAGLHLLK